MTRYRLYAMKEKPQGDKAWAFYFEHSAEHSLDKVSVDEVIYTWGDWGSSQAGNRSVQQVQPGKPVLLWRDDDDAAEINIDIIVSIETQQGNRKIRFEFPKLYKLTAFPVDGDPVETAQ